MHDGNIFTELGLVFVIVAIVAGLMRFFRQPLILGYIFTGILVGPIALDLIHAKDAFEGFSQVGITLLLFIIGLGMNVGVIKSLGRVSIVTAALLLFSVGGLGFLATHAFGFDWKTSLIVGAALFFSSTIIILKTLSDKREVHRLHGQIAIGIILVDDIVATLAIVVVAMLGHGSAVTTFDLELLGIKAAALCLLLWAVGAFIMPHASKRFAKNQELLFLFAIAWGFGIALLFQAAGFSREVGALFAGVSLAGLPYAAEMGARLKPLRDFFVVLFFVSLGESFLFDDIAKIVVPAIALSLIVIFGKPFFVMLGLGVQGYTKLTSFKAGVHLSQISEFSIVLVVFANQLHVVNNKAASIVTLVALITIGASSYLMKYDDILYRKFERGLKIFERRTIKERPKKQQLYQAILFGYHHGGHEFLQLFRDTHQRYLIVDYDPEIIEHLEAQGIRHAYGDATDSEFMEDINAGRANFVASTITDLGVNKLILSYLHRYNPDVTFICHASTYEDALTLYDHGASYVILPRFLGSEYITSHIKRYGMDKEAFAKFRQKHIVSIGRQAVENA